MTRYVTGCWLSFLKWRKTRRSRFVDLQTEVKLVIKVRKDLHPYLTRSVSWWSWLRGLVPVRAHSEGWVRVWLKKVRMDLGRREGERKLPGQVVVACLCLGKLGEQRKGRGREGEWRAPGLAPWLAETCSRLGKLGERRKGGGREGEWWAPGLALLVPACSRLGSSVGRGKGGEERGNGGRRGLRRG